MKKFSDTCGGKYKSTLTWKKKKKEKIKTLFTNNEIRFLLGNIKDPIYLNHIQVL